MSRPIIYFIKEFYWVLIKLLGLDQKGMAKTTVFVLIGHVGVMTTTFCCIMMYQPSVTWILFGFCTTSIRMLVMEEMRRIMLKRSE